MTDVYVYYFLQTGPTGVKSLSNRRATLETIRQLGDAVMESQIVVDQTEVDDKGFARGHDRNESHPMDMLWSQIMSLERRANSRDSEAILLDEKFDAQGKYLLTLESRELRKQAKALRTQRLESLIGDVTGRFDHDILSGFPHDPIAG